MLLFATLFNLLRGQAGLLLKRLSWAHSSMKTLQSRNAVQLSNIKFKYVWNLPHSPKRLEDVINPRNDSAFRIRFYLARPVHLK
jgi:hypothetical protein